MTSSGSASLTGLQRTLNFVAGKAIDRTPCHPIVMRWAARQADIRYRDFVLNPTAKCDANIYCAETFGFDWVTVLSDPYTEAEAFGLRVEYPEDNLPMDVGGHLPDAASVAKLSPYNPRHHPRCRNRIREIEEYRQRVGDTHFIVGWIEGPVAEYADLRGAGAAALDLLDEPDSVSAAMDIIVEAAREFAGLQVKAGAHCIGIGDAFCSQIGPALYREFAFEREKELIAQIHSLGALVKLHICGNTTSILSEMIATGADIIDVDHLVSSMAPFAALLAPHQVFAGKADPVSVIQEGSHDIIAKTVRRDILEAGGRCIISAGCEITPGTSLDNMSVFCKTAEQSIP